MVPKFILFIMLLKVISYLIIMIYDEKTEQTDTRLKGIYWEN